MADEPSLPGLPVVGWDEHSQSLSQNPRKRVRNPRSRSSPSLACNSSDPAVFSSDDDPGLDNYVEGRRKKRYVGSWFQQHPTSSDSTFSEGIIVPKQSKRTLARQVDSGVFLGSDGTDGEDIMDALDITVRSKLPQLDKRPIPRVSEAELAAREKIRVCIEQGDETIDFWSLGLEELSNETISPLSNLSCIPLVTKDVAFEQKEPELKVYLAMNRLRRIPGALFDLTHLTILSLRGNKLTELPPAISKLCNLKQLNVSQNRLRYLPAELLGLLELGGNLRNLVLHPNPFYEPDKPFEHNCDSYKVVADDTKPEPHFFTWQLGRSPLQLSDSRGEVLSHFKLPSAGMPQKIAVDASGDVQSEPPASSISSHVGSSIRSARPRPSPVPSLVQASLRGCYSSAQLPELQYYMPDGLQHLRQLLDRATRQKEMGGITCSRCKRLLIVPTIEWVEWRELSTCTRRREDIVRVMEVLPLSLAEDEMAVPFLYRACSWNCGPAQ
ncbi:hypothetical protein TOPH_07600 [Tolypocladium ophioglossoides CBS 100239]|uniref:Uncharacterized protein n=1 Tax=Tolypocladium ophioglossoides (strain CBS 100239) TaxID=1163406 RepID=A0A0L0N1W0_TOLOC|nr:hypothetical protein TOPH_07600 [Tolypocladium ophioglossoides CBS 100239]